MTIDKRAEELRMQMRKTKLCKICFNREYFNLLKLELPLCREICSLQPTTWTTLWNAISVTTSTIQLMSIVIKKVITVVLKTFWFLEYDDTYSSRADDFGLSQKERSRWCPFLSPNRRCAKSIKSPNSGISLVAPTQIKTKLACPQSYVSFFQSEAWLSQTTRQHGL